MEMKHAVATIAELNSVRHNDLLHHLGKNVGALINDCRERKVQFDKTLATAVCMNRGYMHVVYLIESLEADTSLDDFMRLFYSDGSRQTFLAYYLAAWPRVAETRH